MLITMNDRELQRLTIIQDALHHKLSRRFRAIGFKLSTIPTADHSLHSILWHMEIEANRIQIASMKASSCRY